MSRGRNTMRSSGRREGERGAVLVETAILIPIILIITFGLIEFSMVYQSSSTGAGAARARGAYGICRSEAPELRDGRGQGDCDRAPHHRFERTRRDVGLQGQRPGLSRFGWQHEFQRLHDQLHQVRLATRNQDVRRCQPDRKRLALLDAASVRYRELGLVGVYIKLSHKYLTNLFGSSITLTDHAVFRLEPAPTQLCG